MTSRIFDISEAAQKVSAIVARGHDYFLSDDLAQLASERLIEIIGEACSKISEETQSLYPSIAWKDIGGMRIRLAHHYHRIDSERVWSAASVDVPALATALRVGGVELIGSRMSANAALAVVQ
jgi:uncharacterized protein with HEPN domain